MKNIIKYTLVFYLIILNPITSESAEILQINSSHNILVGDQNRNLSIELFCANIDESDEQIAINLLKKEFPRGSKVKIRPISFKENILISKVFNIKETKEMSQILLSEGLIKDNCQN